jgi:hypothetical protein
MYLGRPKYIVKKKISGKQYLSFFGKSQLF